MSAADRTVVAAIAFMYVAIPLYGTFEVLDPEHPPIPALVGVHGAIAIALAMLAAAAICAWGAFRRPAPRRIVLAQLLAGTAIIPAALLGFDPQTGFELVLIVLAMGIVGVALYGYSELPGVTRTIVIAWLASATLATVTALVMIVVRNPAGLYAYDNGRAVGTFLNPNELAAYLLVVLGLAAGVALYARSTPLRLLAGVTLIAGLAGLAATYSRWGFLSAVAGALFFAILAGGRRIWLGLAVVVLAGVFLVVGPGALHHNPRDDTSRIIAFHDRAADVAGISAHRCRTVPISAHVRRVASARGAGRRGAGGIRSAQPAAGVSRRVGSGGVCGAPVVLVGVHPRDSAGAALGRSPAARARVRGGGWSRRAQRPRPREYDQHLLRAGHPRRGAGAGARATGSRCACGLNCYWPRC